VLCILSNHPTIAEPVSLATAADHHQFEAAGLPLIQMEEASANVESLQPLVARSIEEKSPEKPSDRQRATVFDCLPAPEVLNLFARRHRLPSKPATGQRIR
jgi:hypothetical protein